MTGARCWIFRVFIAGEQQGEVCVWGGGGGEGELPYPVEPPFICILVSRTCYVYGFFGLKLANVLKCG